MQFQQLDLYGAPSEIAPRRRRRSSSHPIAHITLPKKRAKFSATPYKDKRGFNPQETLGLHINVIRGRCEMLEVWAAEICKAFDDRDADRINELLHKARTDMHVDRAQ
jgi:hypothetical protein